jgi:hypothetical protein
LLLGQNDLSPALQRSDKTRRRSADSHVNFSDGQAIEVGEANFMLQKQLDAGVADMLLNASPVDPNY